MRFYILDYGLFQVSEPNRTIGIPGFLIETGKAKILVDTGFPARYVQDAENQACAEGIDSFGQILTFTEENLPKAQLARVGRSPADITHVILTHTHIDHVGNLAEFTHAQIVVGKAEHALIAPLYWGNTRPISWPAANYVEIDRDTDLVPGVRILYTPGHTPGHLSLLLKLRRTGPLLITADALSWPDELEGDFDGAWNPLRARASAHRLMEIAEKIDASVIFGHDPRQWPRLRKAPEWYG